MFKSISYSEKGRFIQTYVDPVPELLYCVSVGPLSTFRGKCKSEGSKGPNSLRYVGRLPLGLTVLGAGSEARSGPMGAVKNKCDKNKGFWSSEIFGVKLHFPRCRHISARRMVRNCSRTLASRTKGCDSCCLSS